MSAMYNYIGYVLLYHYAIREKRIFNINKSKEVKYSSNIYKVLINDTESFNVRLTLSGESIINYNMFLLIEQHMIFIIK